MILHNFYFILWYALWGYILLCLCGKLFLDATKNAKRRRRTDQITALFSKQLPPNSKQKRRLKKHAADDLLFEHICKSYFRFRREYPPEERPQWDAWFQDLVTKRIESPAMEDVQMRCLMLWVLNQLPFSSAAIRRFLNECAAGSKLEQALAEKIDSQVVV